MDNKLIGIKGGRNFRDLGGYKTKDNQTIKSRKLIRSGLLAPLTNEDLKLLEAYQVAYDIDFRSQEEAEKEPDRVPAGTEYVFNPVFSQDLTESNVSIEDLIMESANDGEFGFNRMIESYHDIVVSEHSQKSYRKFFDYLLQVKDDESLLFHCTAGKDRTGMGAFYLLGVLGVDLETIKKDYLISNSTTRDFFNHTTLVAQEAGASAASIKSIQALMTVHEEYLDEAINTIDTNYGNFSSYIKNILQLSNDEISTLKNIYLD